MKNIKSIAWEILSPKENAFTRLIHTLDKHVYRRISEFLDPMGLSQTQALFIIYLGYYESECVYQNTLEKTFGLTNPTVTTSIKSLINKNILFREKDPKDGRYYRLFLTDEGKELFPLCVDAFTQANKYFNEKLNQEEEAMFIKLVNKLIS